MALSGTISKSIYRGYYTYRMDWTATQSIAGNYSDVTVVTRLIWTEQLNVGSRSAYTTVNGSKQTYTVASVGTGSGSRVVNTHTFRVYHDNTGKASVSATAYYPIKATLGGTYYADITATGTITLDDIPRYSTIAVTSPAEMGTSQVVTVTQASSTFSTILSAKPAFINGTIVDDYYEIGRFTSQESEQYVYTLPDITTALLTADTYTYTLKADTYTEADYTGTLLSSTQDITAQVPATVVPAGSMVLSDYSSVPSGWGWIVGYSKPRATFNFDGTNDQGGYFKSAVAKFGSLETQTFEASDTTTTTAILDCTKTLVSVTPVITGTLTDSRGRSLTFSETLTTVAYNKPQIAIELTRCDASGNADITGTYAKVRAKWTIQPFNNTNSGTLRVTAGSSTLTYTPTVLTQNTLTTIGILSGLDPASDTSVTATLTDRLASSTISATLPKSTVALSTWSDGTNYGVAFGYPAIGAGFYNYLDTNLVTGKAINLVNADGSQTGTSMTTDDLFTSSEPSIETITNAVTRTSGASITEQKLIKYGKVCQLQLRINTTSTSAGNNLFVGTLAEAYRPIVYTTGSSYTSQRNVAGLIEPSGNITIRNANTVTINAGQGIAISFTFLID